MWTLVFLCAMQFEQIQYYAMQVYDDVYMYVTCELLYFVNSSVASDHPCI